MAVLLAAMLLVSQAIDPIPPPYAPPTDEIAHDEPEAEVAEPEPTPVPVVGVRAVWDRLAVCESTSNWHANTGNGYYGGVQMDMTFWRRYGGTVYAARPDLASRESQVVVAERGLAVQGWAAWPACSRRLGLR